MAKNAEAVKPEDSNVEEKLAVPEGVPEADKLNVQAKAEEILKAVQEGKQELTDLDDDQRDVLIHNFNQKNKGIAEIVDEKPTKEFVEQCKKDFEDYQNEYYNIDYEVTGKEHALEYAKWLKDWNKDHAVLPKNYWIGCLKFDEVITEIIKKIEANPEENLSFDYGALTYCYNLMMGPVGTGIEYARWMAENQEVYNAILNKLDDHTHMVELIRRKIALLQNRWGMACQGFKVNLLISKLEDLEKLDVAEHESPDTEEETPSEESAEKAAE